QKNRQMLFKESIEAALDSFLGSRNSAATMSAVEELDFALLSTGKMGLLQSVFGMTAAASEATVAARSHLHASLVNIVLENRMSKLSTSMIECLETYTICSLYP
ncbi:hypothetical protein C0991_007173, partial [Blastosporella zonata]